MVIEVCRYTGWSRSEVHALTIEALEDEAEGVLESHAEARRKRGGG